jgi:hypothetical protein
MRAFVFGNALFFTLASLSLGQEDNGEHPASKVNPIREGLQGIAQVISDAPAPIKNVIRPINGWFSLGLGAAEYIAGRSVGDIAVDTAASWVTTVGVGVIPALVFSTPVGVAAGLVGSYFLADDLADWTRRKFHTREGEAASTPTRTGVVGQLNQLGEKH